MRRGARSLREAMPSSRSRATGRALEQKVTLARVPRQRSGALEFRTRFIRSAELREQVAADAWQEVIRLERGLRDKRVGKLETGRRTECHSIRDRAVQHHDRRLCELLESVVERRDMGPVRNLYT